MDTELILIVLLFLVSIGIGFFIAVRHWKIGEEPGKNKEGLYDLSDGMDDTDGDSGGDSDSDD